MGYKGVFIARTCFPDDQACAQTQSCDSINFHTAKVSFEIKFGNFRVTFISRIFDFLIISETLNSRTGTHTYGCVYVHRVVALVGIISTLRLSICLVDLPNLNKLMSRCRVKMTQIDILSF